MYACVRISDVQYARPSLGKQWILLKASVNTNYAVTVHDIDLFSNQPTRATP